MLPSYKKQCDLTCLQSAYKEERKNTGLKKENYLIIAGFILDQIQ